MCMKKTLSKLPYGTVVKYKGQLYFKSPGLDGDILTAAKDGMWYFVKELKWKSFQVVYEPERFTSLHDYFCSIDT
jgi:hypothetical protein